MNNYEPFTSPIGFDFDNMTKSEACEFMNRFIETLPSRIAMLEREIQEDSTWSDWRPDGSEESLSAMSCWLEKQAERREPSGDEQQSLRDSITGPLKEVVPAMYFELTPLNYSYARDVAMYLGEVVRQHDSRVQWQLGPKPRSSIYYNRPVIVTPKYGFFKEPFLVITNKLFAYIRNKKRIDIAKLANEWMSWAKSSL